MLLLYFGLLVDDINKSVVFVFVAFVKLFFIKLKIVWGCLGKLNQLSRQNKFILSWVQFHLASEHGRGESLRPSMQCERMFLKICPSKRKVKRNSTFFEPNGFDAIATFVEELQKEKICVMHQTFEA